MRFLLISLISFPLWAAENSVDIDLKGNSSIYIDQIGSGNTARVWCGLSNGTYATHSCSSATIDIDQNGTGNLAKAYSQYTNHTGNEYTFYAFGDDSTWTAAQSGSGNHNAYIKSCGNCNNNDATITQSGSGAKDGDIEFRNNPADNSTVSLTQSGDGAHVGNIRVEQGDYTVNATQTGVSAKAYTVILDCTASCNKTITVNQFDQ